MPSESVMDSGGFYIAVVNRRLTKCVGSCGIMRTMRNIPMQIFVQVNVDNR